MQRKTKTRHFEKHLHDLPAAKQELSNSKKVSREDNTKPATAAKQAGFRIAGEGLLFGVPQEQRENVSWGHHGWEVCLKQGLADRGHRESPRRLAGPLQVLLDENLQGVTPKRLMRQVLCIEFVDPTDLFSVRGVIRPELQTWLHPNTRLASFKMVVGFRVV